VNGKPKATLLLVVAIAVILGFVLFAPAVCSRASETGDTDCTTILGLGLPGFSGRGMGFVPSYAASVVAALIIALAAAGVTASRQRRGR
jgi:hypothetical protein